MRAFKSVDLDRFIAAAKRLLGDRTDPTAAAKDGERKRLVWRIREDAKTAGLDDVYINKLAGDLHGLRCWDELALDDLTNLRNAIHNRAGRKVEADTRTVQDKAERRRIVLDSEKKFVPREEEKPTPAHEPEDELVPF